MAMHVFFSREGSCKSFGAPTDVCYSFLFKLSARYEALKDSMSEAASIPPSWITLAEVMITILRRNGLAGYNVQSTQAQLVFCCREEKLVTATMFPSLPGFIFQLVLV